MALSDAVRDAFNKGNGRQPALLDNTKVLAQIQPSKNGIGYIERGPFSTHDDSPNARITALHLRFVIPAGEQYANRNFFANVPNEFEIWSDKTNGKVPSYQSIGLVKALGYELDDVDDDTLQKMTDREMLYKTVELVLGVEEDSKFNADDPAEAAKAAANPLYGKRNRVKFINKASGSSPKAPVPAGGYAAGGVRATVPAAAAPANDPWAGVAAAATSDPWANTAVGATV